MAYTVRGLVLGTPQRTRENSSAAKKVFSFQDTRVLVQKRPAQRVKSVRNGAVLRVEGRRGGAAFRDSLDREVRQVRNREIRKGTRMETTGDPRPSFSI